MNIGDGQSGGAASPLGDRYSVERELGQQRGRTYVAKDGDRNDEYCVVKSLLSTIKDAALLEEAKSLLEQEAEDLYKLDHRQLPKFRQILEVPALPGAGGQLFLVRDYIQGLSYRALLQDRKQVGGRFHEVEISQLLYQLLPVLSYLHGQGIIHRDICPENIVLRQSDGLPVLVEFGSVKALAASVRSRLGLKGVAEIGHAGYVPPEQIGNDYADETTDLYGLAATLLVLATGEDAESLSDVEAGTWQGYEGLSPKLGRVLRKMLSPHEAERFANADAVLAALQAEDGTGDSLNEATAFGPATEAYPQDSVPGDTLYANAVPVGLAGGVGAAAGAIAAGMTEVTGYDAEGFSPDGYAAEGAGPDGYGPDGYGPDGYADGYEGPIIEDAAIDTTAEPVVLNPTTVGARSSNSAAGEAETYEPEIEGSERMTAEAGDRQALLGLLALLGITGLLLLFALPRAGWFPFGNRQTASSGETNGSVANQVRALADGEYAPEEIARKEEIIRRRGALGISEETFTGIVNQRFYQEYPALLTSGTNGAQQTLSDRAADEPLRIRWDHIAIELLDTLEQNFSTQSLGAIGTYGENNRSDWRSQIAPTGVAARAQTDLTDAKFFRLFPDQAGRDFLSTPIGQIYYALADDRARAIASGSVTESIQYDQGAFSRDVRGQLGPGEGRIYTLALSNGQLLRLNLSAPRESTLLSLYPPTSTDENPSVFSDSEQTTWSGALNETGVYSVVVVNRSAESIDYTLATSVDSVTSTPAPVEPTPVEPAPAEPTPEADEPEAETEINLEEAPIAPPREGELDDDAQEESDDSES